MSTLPAGVYDHAQACFSNTMTPAQYQVMKTSTTADQQRTWKWHKKIQHYEHIQHSTTQYASAVYYAI